MIVDYNAIPETKLSNFKGGEKDFFARMFVDPSCRIMKGRMPAGASIGLHTHEDSCEVVYVLSGKGRAIYDGVEEPMLPGTAHFCPKGHTHTVINDGPEEMEILAIVPQQ